jgi:GNAT superfamily N-acetyltransferase
MEIALVEPLPVQAGEVSADSAAPIDGEKVGVVALERGRIRAGILAATVPHWVTNAPQGLLYSAFQESVTPEPELFQSLIDHLRHARCAQAWTGLRCQLPCAEAASILADRTNWMLDGYKIRRPIGVETPPETHDLRIRRACRSDEPFVLDCLMEAAFTGLSPVEQQRVPATQLKAAVARCYGPLLGDAGIVLIAEVAGTAVAHATVSCSPGGHDAHIVDIFVLKSHNGLGYARALARAVIVEARRAGTASLTGTVLPSATRTTHQTLNELEPDGWTAVAAFASCQGWTDRLMNPVV